MSHDRRIFEEKIPESGELSLSDSNSHYLSNVLRLKVGDPVTVVSSTTKMESECFVTKIFEREVLVKISKNIHSKEYTSRVSILLPALCKAEANEIIVEKATELGVQQIFFWQSKRSVLRLKGEDDVIKKTNRFKKIAESAAKQSGRVTVPEIVLFESLPMALANVRSSHGQSNHFYAILSLDSDAQPPLHYLEELSKKDSTIIAIGAEGDFDPSEAVEFASNGFSKISLGGNRLRSETAAIAGICAIDAVLPPST